MKRMNWDNVRKLVQLVKDGETLAEAAEIMGVTYVTAVRWWRLAGDRTIAPRRKGTMTLLRACIIPEGQGGVPVKKILDSVPIISRPDPNKVEAALRKIRGSA